VLTYALVLIVGFVAGTVSGIVGTGATIILLPILVFAFGRARRCRSWRSSP
jgi:hypothetical protein